MERARSVRRRVRFASFVAQLERFGVAACVASGAATILLRHFAGLSPGEAAWTLLPAAAAVPFAWYRAVRRTPSPETCLAWLDLGTGGSGLVLAGAAFDDTPWRDRAEALLRELPLRRPAIRGGRAACTLALAGLFAASALAVDVSSREPRSTQVLRARTVEEVRRDLDVLASLGIEPEAREDLESRIDRLEALAREESAESFWDARVSLDDRLEEAADRAAKAMMSARGDLAPVGEGLRADGTSETPSAALDRAALAFERAVSALEGAGLDPRVLGLAPSEGAPISAGDLATFLEGALSGIDGGLDRLLAEGLLDPASLEDLESTELADVDLHECDSTCPPGGA